MKLELRRDTFTDKSTIGKLYVDGTFECYTLEDVMRKPGAAKVDGATAIPCETYKVIITMSTRFKKLMPLLLAVAGFVGIRMHCGNTDADTHGCILVGRVKAHDFIGESRAAFEILFAKMQAAIARGEEIEITVSVAEKSVAA